MNTLHLKYFRQTEPFKDYKKGILAMPVGVYKASDRIKQCELCVYSYDCFMLNSEDIPLCSCFAREDNNDVYFRFIEDI